MDRVEFRNEFRVARNFAATAGAAAGLILLVRLYDAGLRDPRFLDGWVLAAAIGGQMLFHARRQGPAPGLGRASRWMRAHVWLGYLTIVVFLLHCDFSMPDSGIEWALWLLFVAVAASGVLGAVLCRVLPPRLDRAPGLDALETIPAERTRIARDVEALALASAGETGSGAIADFYLARLQGFFDAPWRAWHHVRSRGRAAACLHEEIGRLERTADPATRQTLGSIRAHVTTRAALDTQYARQWALQLWLFVHIPATYALIAVSVLHVAVVYAYSAGVP